MDLSHLSDEDLLAAAGLNPMMGRLIHQESGGNPNAVSPKGAQGITQIMPATARDPGYGVAPLQGWDGQNPATAPVNEQIRFGNDYLNAMQSKFGSPQLAAAAYNDGPGAVENAPNLNALPAETQQYVKNVAPGNLEITPASQTIQQPDYSQMSDAELMAAAGIQPRVTAPQEDGFMSRLQNDFARRKAQISGLADQADAGDISTPEAVIRGMLKGGQLPLDAAGEVLSSVTPDFIKEPFSNAVAYVADTTPVRAAVDQVNNFNQNHPLAAGRIGSVFDAANLLAPFAQVGGKNAVSAIADATSKPLSKANQIAVKAGAAIEKSGVNAADNAKLDFAQELVLPRETPSTLANQTRKEVGFNRKQVVEPSAYEQEVAQTVADIKGVKKSNSLLGNENIIALENEFEAKKLASDLQKNNVKINDSDVLDMFTNIEDQISKIPGVAAGSSKAATPFINDAFDIISKTDGTAAGLFQARKDFDKLVKKYRGERSFDPNTDSIVTDSIKLIRQNINDTVAKAVPTARVADSLRKQSNLYYALDNIAAKRARESTTRLGRTAKSLQDKISLKGAILATGTAAGLPLAGLPAIPAALTAGAGYGAYKIATAPNTRKIIGKALQAGK